jgi:quinol monooxygenase YgiN
MIIVTGTLHARPESFVQVMALSRAHVLRSRTEPGCLEHAVTIDADDPLRLVFFERWADREAIDAHLKLPASRGFGKTVAALVDEPPTLSMFEASEVPVR